MTDWDVIIIGAGIAGVSAAYELSRTQRVLVLEQEAQPGYHATGRSGAVFIDAYGNETVQALTASSKDFFLHPPDGFCDGPLLRERELFVVGSGDQAEILQGLAEMLQADFPKLALVDGAALEARIPLLRKGVIACALHDPDCQDMDVGALLNGYLRGAVRRGAEFLTDAAVSALERQGDVWYVTTGDRSYRSPIVVNAAGAWVERVAALAGCRPLGITPMRRTLVTVPAPPGIDVHAWPLVGDVGERWYFKPESGHIMISPSEEDAVEPCDARPDEMTVAEAIDRVQGVLDLPVRRIQRQWAGLRTFARDRSPVVGFDAEQTGFFWLAGQGGFGIQTAPALARITAALIEGRGVPDDVAQRGVHASDLGPARLMAV